MLQLQEEQLPLDALGPLAVLSSLRCLGLQGCDASISQHCPWHCFPQLTRVDLHGSCVSDLAPLQVRRAGCCDRDICTAAETSSDMRASAARTASAAACQTWRHCR
jgi:hypothetical protein